MRPQCRLGWVCLVALLAAHASGDTVDNLIRTLATTDNPKVKVQACIFLGKRGDRRALQVLSGALRDDHDAVRVVAAQALGKIGDRDALPALNGALRDPVPVVVATARRAIAAIEAQGGPSGSAGIAVHIGPLSSRSREGGREVVALFRELLVRELRRTPGVLVDAQDQRGRLAYWIDGSISRLTIVDSGNMSEISCDLKVLVATWPGKSILMWTDGGATVQTGLGSANAGLRDCLEAAVQSVRENIATFLKAQR